MNDRNLISWPWSRRTLTRANDPFAALHREMDQVFESFFRDWDVPAARERGSLAVAAPRIDVAENAGAFVITAEMPGLTDKDFEVAVADGVLTIKGEKKAESKKDEGEYHWSERTFGRFERTFSLPPSVDADRADARYEQGVLTLTLPKIIEPEKQPKKIDVKTK